MFPTPYQSALFCLMLNILFWASGCLFIKYLTFFYNAWAQNAFRYSCAAVVLLVATALTRRLTFRLSSRVWKSLLLITVCNVCMQTACAATYYFIYPSVASLIQSTTILFVITLSFLFFHDERRVIRSGRFQIGCVLVLTGVLLVTFGQDAELLSRLKVSGADFWIGVGLALTYAIFLAAYSVTIKHLVRELPPLISFTHVSWMTSVGLIALMLCMGGASDLWRQPVKPFGIMVLSAVLCIAIAHSALFVALRHIKAVVSSAIMHLTPVLTCIGSAFVYGDHLSALQIGGGALVICGALLAAITEARLKDERRMTNDE
jgi:drug/metabolite transporter (DMT)-like permease